MTGKNSEVIHEELRPVLYRLYAYHVRLKNIIEKIREKNIGRKGQLTEEEKEFLKPIMYGFLEYYRPIED